MPSLELINVPSSGWQQRLQHEIIFVTVEDLSVCVSQRNFGLSRIWTRLIMLMVLFWFSQ